MDQWIHIHNPILNIFFAKILTRNFLLLSLSVICSPGRERERGERSGYFRHVIVNIGHNPSVYRINSINTCPMRAAQDTSYMARHRALFAMALRRHKSRPMMGYMCRRHATVSCENVSRDPMGPPVIFTSCLLPSGAPQARPRSRGSIWRTVLLRGLRVPQDCSACSRLLFVSSYFRRISSTISRMK